MKLFDEFGNLVGTFDQYPDSSGMGILVLFEIAFLAIKWILIALLIPFWVPIVIVLLLADYARGGELNYKAIAGCFVLLAIYSVFLFIDYFHGGLVKDVIETLSHFTLV